MKKYIQILIIIILGFIVYSNTFSVPMYLDDEYNIESHLLKDVTNLKAIWGYRPFAFISYLTISFNRTYFGMKVFSYHVVNLLIHLSAALCVFWLAFLLLKTPKTADLVSKHKHPERFGYIPIFTALLFVCHPVQTESITYIIQRSTALAALFYLLSACFYLKARFNKSKGKSPFYYILSFIVCVFAMFTKPIAFTLPLIILLIEFAFFDDNAGLIKKRLVYLLPFLLCLLVIPVTLFLTSDVNIQEIGDLTRETTTISRNTYFLTQFNVILTYIRLFFLPVNQNLDYDYPLSKTIFEPSTFFSFIFLISLFLFALNIFKKNRLISFGIFWFFLALSIESSLFPIRDVIFEHRCYLPSVGFFLSLTTIILAVAPRLNKRYLLFFLSIMVFCYSLATYKRNMLWGDKVKFLEDGVSKSPNKARRYNNLGNMYVSVGKKEEAITLYKKALELDVNSVLVYNNLGLVYKDIGKEKEAIVLYEKAIETDPQYDLAYNNLGLLYRDTGERGKAIDLYKKAIEINPYFVQAYNNLGNAYFDAGKTKEAIALYKKAIEIHPHYVDAYNNLGNAYSHIGKTKEAITELKKALEIDPAYEKAYNNLGIVYRDTGNGEEAMRLCKKAIELNPDYSDAYLNLGNIYLDLGKEETAISSYKKALKKDKYNATSLYNLGVVYNFIGQREDAIDSYKKAIEINSSYADACFNLASVYENMKNTEEAITLYKKTVKINPNYIRAHYQLGNIYLTTGKAEEAVTSYKKAIELEPDNTGTYYNLGSAYFLADRMNEAISAYKKSLELDPDDIVTLNSLGNAYKKTGKEKEAIELFKKIEKLKAHRKRDGK